MADTKISALPSATTPLAGTEVLPIVQSGVTRQVSVANLTANRAISATQLTLSTGNLIVASGQGIDFSATPGTGTSELLNDYEEGDWTPADGSGAGLVFTVNYAKYTKVGREVSYMAFIYYPVTIDPTAASIQGFPFVAGNAVLGNVNYTTEPAASLLYLSGNTTKLFLLIPGNNTTNAQMSGEALIFSGTYFI